MITIQTLSTTTSAHQILFMPYRYGRRMTMRGSIKIERRQTILAEVIPSLKAVKNAEPNLLKPVNKNAKIEIFMA